MRLLAVTRDHRCYLLGRRIHHGLVGALAAFIGLVLAVHDRRDWPWPLRDRA